MTSPLEYGVLPVQQKKYDTPSFGTQIQKDTFSRHFLLSDLENKYRLFQQECATVHATNSSVVAYVIILGRVFRGHSFHSHTI